MSVVHVRPAKTNHAVHFVFDGLAHGLDAQGDENLANVVGRGAVGVHLALTQHLQQAGPIRFQQPLGLPLEFSRFVHKHTLFVRLIFVGIQHVDFGDFLDAQQSHAHEHITLQLAQQLVICQLPFLQVILLHLIVLDADAQDGVVVVRIDAHNVVAVLGLELLVNLTHGQLLVHNANGVQLDAQQPGRPGAGVFLGLGVQIVVDKGLVLGNDRVARVWVVVDGGGAGDVAQRAVLQPVEHGLGVVRGLGGRPGEVHHQRGGLGVLAHVDNLLQARHAQRDVLGGHAGKVEGVERHLGSRLAQRLRGQRAHHLTRLGLRLHEAVLHLGQDPVKGFLGQVVLQNGALAAQHGAQQTLKLQGGVLLGHAAEGVRAHHHHQSLDHLAQALHHVQRVQVRGRAAVNVEDLLRVPNQALNVDRQRHVGLAARVHKAQALAVLRELLKLGQQRILHLVVGADVLHDRVLQVAAQHGPVALAVQEELLAELVRADGHGGQLLVLDKGAVHAVLAVAQLDQIAVGVAHRAVVLQTQALHALDQAPLDVAGLCRLDSRVNETLAPAHGVEEELLRRQPSQVRVEHKPLGVGPVVVLDKVRQRAIAEAKGNALALDVLLAHAGNDLGNVEVGALGPGHGHGLEVVELGQRLERAGPGILARLVQLLVDLLLNKMKRTDAQVSRKRIPARLQMAVTTSSNPKLAANSKAWS
eukprot:m.293933 g.293933  ORF g.293933 m.293933 type:complete len:699 (-) comp22962_c0_seq7:2402-4498(-)